MSKIPDNTQNQPATTEPPPKTTLLAAVQPPFAPEKSPAANQRMIQRGFAYAEQAFAGGAAFVCLPEFFNVFGLPAEQMLEAATANWEALLGRGRELARRFEGHLVLPMLYPEESDGARSRAWLIGPDGENIGCYDKIHPTLGEKEMFGLVGGKRAGVFETRHGRVAIAICYDIYFPELFTALSRRRPEVIFFPSLQRSEHEPAAEAMVKTRAMDTSAFFVRSSFGCPADLPWQPGLMFGRSGVVHPDGTHLADAGHYEGIALAAVRLPFVWQRRRCGGRPPMPVRDFLGEDRRDELFPPDRLQ